MTINESPLSARYQQACMERTCRRLQDCPEQQTEAIERHYMANAVMAQQILTLLKLVDGRVEPLPDVEDAISMLVDAIKFNHAKDFGIALEWPKDKP